jgi:hypothetical protein
MNRLHFCRVGLVLAIATLLVGCVDDLRRQETSGAVPPAATLRVLRGIQVLERIGTAEARGVLRDLASGAAARETREAKAALERLAARTPLGR